MSVPEDRFAVAPRGSIPRTVATFQGYYQSAAIRRSKVASMLETPPPKDA
ncbi:hypothetical protein RCH10_004710 [Variovorax sp. GrIS 2.14]